jgi:hypothetical protein
MPGLMRMATRTAVVAGTATAVSGRVARRQQGRWNEQDAAQQQAAAPPPQYAAPQYAPPPPAPAAAAASTDDKLAQLSQLGALRDAGVLTDIEFEVQKSKILAS